MKSIAADLHSIIETAGENLSRIDRDDASLRPAPGKWSKKEILGHLVDSAVNNHQRFVRAQHCEALAFPGYEQDAWVANQNYNDVEWKDLIELWVLFNRHLARTSRTRWRSSITSSVGAGLLLRRLRRFRAAGEIRRMIS